MSIAVCALASGVAGIAVIDAGSNVIASSGTANTVNGPGSPKVSATPDASMSSTKRWNRPACLSVASTFSDVTGISGTPVAPVAPASGSGAEGVDAGGTGTLEDGAGIGAGGSGATQPPLPDA